MVLEGAPASIVDIGSQRYPFFPIRLLIRNPFESITRIGKVGSPLLFLHEVAGGHVHASEKDPQFFPAVRSFLHAHRLLP